MRKYNMFNSSEIEGLNQRVGSDKLRRCIGAILNKALNSGLRNL